MTMHGTDFAVSHIEADALAGRAVDKTGVSEFA
jgi:hypothetical protein